MKFINNYIKNNLPHNIAISWWHRLFVVFSIFAGSVVLIVSFFVWYSSNPWPSIEKKYEIISYSFEPDYDSIITNFFGKTELCVFNHSEYYNYADCGGFIDENYLSLFNKYANLYPDAYKEKNKMTHFLGEEWVEWEGVYLKDVFTSKNIFAKINITPRLELYGIYWVLIVPLLFLLFLLKIVWKFVIYIVYGEKTHD